jgi:hypothetical protein
MAAAIITLWIQASSGTQTYLIYPIPNHLYFTAVMLNTYTLIDHYHKQLLINLNINAEQTAVTISVTSTKQQVIS